MTMDKARSGSANHPSPDGSGPYFAGYRAGFSGTDPEIGLGDLLYRHPEADQKG